jgi:predicted DNA-binding transcriptional regulator AlpA
MLTEVPTLDALSKDPDSILSISPAVALQLLAKVVSLQTLLLARAMAPGTNGHEPASSDDRLLTAAEAAEHLGHSVDWIYRNAKILPFTVRTGRDLRFSAAGLAKWIRARLGR